MNNSRAIFCRLARLFKRYIEVNGLVSGTTYTFQIRAAGGSTKFSDWSDPVSHMAV